MNISYINKTIPSQKPEKYYGNREYKRNILINNSNYIQKKASQMLFRLIEGKGKALYLVGIDDNGSVIGLNKSEFNRSINLLKSISNEIEAKIKNIYVYKGGKGNVISVRIYLPEKNLINIQNCLLIN